MADFPTSIYTQTDLTCADVRLPKDIVNSLKDEVIALETKVGKDSSAVTTSFDYKLNNTASGNALSATNKIVDTDFTDTADVGWLNFTPTLTYSSADSPQFVVTIADDYTSTLREGGKLELVQSATTKYFRIVKCTYSAPTTTVVLNGGTDYTLAAATITDVRYSYETAPENWPLDDAKWTVTASPSDYLDQTSLGTYKNVGEITLGIGTWSLGFKCLSMVQSITNGRSMFYGYDTASPSTTTGTVLEPFFAETEVTTYDNTGDVTGMGIAHTSQLQNLITITTKRTIYFNANVESGAVRGRLRNIKLFATLNYK